MMIPIPTARHAEDECAAIEPPLAVPGIEEVRITAKTDQLLEPLPEGASYLGFIFARGPDAPIGRRRVEGCARAAALRDRGADRARAG